MNFSAFGQRVPGGNPKALLCLWLFVLLAAAAPMGWASSEGGGHGESSGAKGWVATDTYRVINFAVLAGGLFLLLRKPISQALKGRIRDIQDQLNDLERKKKEAEAQLAEYNERLSLLNREAEKIISEYALQGQEASARIIKEAEAAAGKIEAQARRNIEQEFKQVKEQLQYEVLEKALGKAEALLKETVTADDQDRLVEEYLDKVVTG